MRIVIDFPDEEYNKIEPLLNGETVEGGFNGFRALEIIKNGTPLPDGAEILTKEAYSDLCTRAADVPSVEPERKPGHWEWDQRTGEYVCSECGCNPIYEGTTPDVSEIDKYKYCRWCGAKMEVDG